jgi:hypothetical protein
MAESLRELKSQLANAKNKALNARDKLTLEMSRNRNKDLPEKSGAAYEAANTAFKAAGKEVGRLEKAVTDFKEVEKKETPKQIADKKEKLRQEDIIAGRDPDAEAAKRDKVVTQEQVKTEQQTALATLRDYQSELATATNTVAKLSETKRKDLAGQLNRIYGISLPQDGLWSQQLSDFYAKAIQDNYGRSVAFNEEIPFANFLLIAEKEGTYRPGAGGKDELPKPFGQQEIYNRSTAEGVIDSIFTSLNLGREASKTEIDTLYKQLQAEQKKLSSMSKGTYKMVNGRRVLVQESGLDARTFLENKVKELPAYKESQAAKSEKNKMDLASTALANGYNLEVDFAYDLPNWLDAINKGKSIDEFKNKIRVNARRMLPEAVRNQIPPDEDLSTTFSMFTSNIAKARGLPVSAIKLSDVIPLAVTDKGFATSQEFEVRKIAQPWWDSSPEGIDKTITVINDTLKNFGMLGQGVRTV